MYYIACHYCGKYGVMANQCDCSTPEIRRKIDQLKYDLYVAEDKHYQIKHAIKELMLKYDLGQEVTEQFLNSIRRSVSGYFDDLEKHLRVEGRRVFIVAAASDLFMKKSRSMNSTYIKKLQHLLETLNVDRRYEDSINFPYLTVEEVMNRIKNEVQD